MKFKIAFIGFSLFSVLNCFAQGSLSINEVNFIDFPVDSASYKWVNRTTYNIDSNEVWAVDGIGNVFISQDGVTSKYDSIGVLKFSQSIKSMGKMRQLLPINSMKLVHFSEEQQTLCFLDNTLTIFNGCLDLSERNIVNASFVEASSRPDLIWVFDNLNSKLVLMSVNDNSQQRQEIDNLGGILDLKSISQIIERGYRLYIVESGKGIYILDMYGSLMEHREEENLIAIDADGDRLFILYPNELKFVNEVTDSEITISLPMEGILEMAYRNQHFYFRTSQHVHKFRLQFVK